MPESIRAAAVSEVPPGTGKELTVGRRIVALYNVDSTFHALDGICPHAGGPLGEGVLNGNVVTCPWHGWQFDVCSGQHCMSPNLSHSTYPVSVEGDEVFVEIPSD